MPSFKGSGMGRVFPTNSLGENNELNTFALSSRATPPLLLCCFYAYLYYCFYFYYFRYLLLHDLCRAAPLSRNEGEGCVWKHRLVVIWGGVWVWRRARETRRAGVAWSRFCFFGRRAGRAQSSSDVAEAAPARKIMCAS